MRTDAEVLNDFKSFLINYFLFGNPITSGVYVFYCGDAILYGNIGHREYWANFIYRMCEHKLINGESQYVCKLNQMPKTEKELEELFIKLTSN
jgi:hypothetical protein